VIPVQFLFRREVTHNSFSGYKKSNNENLVEGSSLKSSLEIPFYQTLAHKTYLKTFKKKVLFSQAKIWTLVNL